jgi:hypothetical protein
MLISATPAGIRNFAGLYVIGNIIALCATGFLVGPRNQCKKMFDETRRWSCAFYLAMLIIVFVTALTASPCMLGKEPGRSLSRSRWFVPCISASTWSWSSSSSASRSWPPLGKRHNLMPPRSP